MKNSILKLYLSKQLKLSLLWSPVRLMIDPIIILCKIETSFMYFVLLTLLSRLTLVTVLVASPEYLTSTTTKASVV